ncbi:unnamed protein product [Mytilus edulis]|uniref:Uncharacterized protein n=1 Tax=Mytilus edulis TaxID=6550 RepID=A0A8S3SCU1_MYTED|nr:unnamed protein product [Mytilus edulis]
MVVISSKYITTQLKYQLSVVETFWAILDDGNNSLSLQGKPREVALEVDPSDLNVDEWVGKLITKLDKLFKKDKIDQASAAYTIVDQLHRGEDVSMSDYIIELEQRYNKCKKYDIGLLIAFLAFKLLDNAGLSQSNRQLALTACSDLKFDTMKSALNRIFASKSQNFPGEQDSVVTVKEESAFVSDGYYQRGRSSRRNFPCNRADKSTNSSRLKTKMNPVFNGNVSRCKICDSKFHWGKDCPHKQLDVNLTEHESDELNETVNITLLTSAQEFKPRTVFVAEAFNAAVIDTAFYKTRERALTFHGRLPSDGQFMRDENQENVEESAIESAAQSADQDDSHVGSQNGSLNGEDSPESEGRDSLDLENQTENDIHEENDDNEDVPLNDTDITEAKEAEMDNWRKHDVYEEVEDNGQNCISTRWAYTLKK